MPFSRLSQAVNSQAGGTYSSEIGRHPGHFYRGVALEGGQKVKIEDGSFNDLRPSTQEASCPAIRPTVENSPSQVDNPRKFRDASTQQDSHLTSLIDQIPRHTLALPCLCGNVNHIGYTSNSRSSAAASPGNRRGDEQSFQRTPFSPITVTRGLKLWREVHAAQRTHTEAVKAMQEANEAFYEDVYRTIEHAFGLRLGNDDHLGEEDT